jgi:glycosyltransferase involved in cell wall biosynthesis
MVKLSVIIPSYKDPLLHQTISSLLLNSELGEQLVVIPVLDGYWPETPIINDERVNVVHLGKNRGMRGAINAGVSIAKGEFIMRTDEHCAFAKGYDRVLTSSCQPNWIMTTVRYFLDPLNWQLMDIPPVIYEKLVIQNNAKFSGAKWDRLERKDILIDETMAMQGSMWLMPRKWWNDVIGELQTDGYGPLYQDSHEMVFKTWKAGGKLMINKNTWFAHKHRSFARTHNDGTSENPANKQNGWKYSLDTWREYYEKEIKPRWNLQ